VLCWLAFPLAPALRSTGSDVDCSTSFAGFAATMARSDFPRSCIIGFGILAFPMRTGACANGRTWDLPVPVRGACAHARVCDRAEPSGCSRWRIRSSCLPLRSKRQRLGVCFFRGSMAGLCVPLPTLRLCPYGQRRTARGRCGSLLLHRSGLAPPTPRRSPGAQATKQSRQHTQPLDCFVALRAPRNDALFHRHARQILEPALRADETLHLLGHGARVAVVHDP
jgi:hypothetical protein